MLSSSNDFRSDFKFYNIVVLKKFYNNKVVTTFLEKKRLIKNYYKHINKLQKKLEVINVNM